MTKTTIDNRNSEVTIMNALTTVRKWAAGAVLIGLFSIYPAIAGAVSMADFTAFPAFLPRVVSPNILFLMDYSAGMVKPAYGNCYDYEDDTDNNCRSIFVNPYDDYDSSQDYYGYFEPSKRYDCTTGASGQCEIASAGAWDGNFLNWLAMLQFDVVKKVVIGGDLSPAPEGAPTPNTLSSIVGNSDVVNIYKAVSDTVRSGNAPAFASTAPQEIPYDWIDTPASTADNPTLVEVFGSVDEDDPATKSSTLDLPFDITLRGTTYEQFQVEVGGRVFLMDPSDSSNVKFYLVAYNPTFTNSTSIGARTLRVSSNKSTVSTFVEGAAPNRVFVVSYEKMVSSADGNAEKKTLDFQTLVFESSSQIIFQYKELRDDKDWGGSDYAYMRVWESGWDKNISNASFPSTIDVQDESAYFMTPDAALYKVTTGATTKFNEAPYVDGTSPAYHLVEIDINSFKRGSGDDDCPADKPYPILTSSGADNKLTCLDHNPSGLMQEFRALEEQGTIGFRLAFMTLAGKGGTGTNVGKNGAAIDANEGTYFNEGLGANMMNALRSHKPTAEAPLAEGLREVIQYFRQDGEKWAGDFTNDNGDSDDDACTGTNPTDPYCFEDAEQKVECCKSYVIIISSGEYTHDFTKNIYGDADVTETVTGVPDLCKSTLDHSLTCTFGTEDTVANGGWLDDVAYYAHMTDLRPSDLGGRQSLGIYAVNTFGGYSGSGGYSQEGAHVLKEAAKYGGFKDANGNDKYDAGEDDINPTGGDGIPDTYFEASGGSNLKDTIMAAVLDILKSSASGTSVSVLSAKSGGEGSIYQAYFYPARIEGEAEERTWPGFMRSFFVDAYRNMRDDHSSLSTTAGTADARLVLKEDRVAQMFLDQAANEVKVRMIRDDDGKDVDPTVVEETLNIDEVQSIWEAGEILAKRDKDTRTIYTWIDLDHDSKPDTGDFSKVAEDNELYLFTGDNKDALAPYLRAGMNTDGTFDSLTTISTIQEAEDIIDFIRGENVVGYRNRCISIDGADKETNDDDRRQDCEEATQRVWPLGDIVFSTPTLVSKPAERYDSLYGSASYQVFRAQYHDRRSMIYVGSNDGMLHAFNSGVLHSGDDPNTGKTENSWFTANPETGNGWGSALLGEELWAFVPFDVLPHLVWTACNGTLNDPSACGSANYTHTYYVDQRPKVTDVQIFADDDDHPGGWGTILIVGLRQGGGAIDVDLNRNGDTDDTGEDVFRSAYYVLDITNPEKKPKLLFRFTNPGLGFAKNYPAIVRVADPVGATDLANVEWFMVIGSGPNNTTSNRDYGSKATTQGGKIFVVNLDTGVLEKTFDSSDTPGELPTANTIMGNAAAIDVNIDFTVDVLYLGSAISNTTGKVFRINTFGDTDPNAWELSTLFDPGRPVFVAPSASMDQFTNFWVFFGTGRYENKDDISNKDQQRFYGIKDACWQDYSAGSCDTTSTTKYAYELTDLFDATNVVVSVTEDDSQVTDTVACADVGGASCSYDDMVSKVRSFKGWRVDLDADGTTASERVLARGAVLGGYVFFTTYTPGSDICSIFGQGALYILNFETGTASGEDIIGIDATDNTIKGRLLLDPGITSEPVISEDSVFIQSSTGQVIKIPLPEGVNIDSSASSWREKSEGSGAVEIEQIYKHIIKNE